MKLLRAIAAAAAAVLLVSVSTSILCVAAAYLLTNGRLKHPFYCGLLFAAASAVIMLAILAVRILIINARYSRIRKIMYEQGVTEEVVSILSAQIEKHSNPVIKDQNRIVLASYLAEGGMFKQCFEVLSQIDASLLSHRWQEEYYNVYVYANLIMGDIDTARQIYQSSKEIFDRARLRPDCSSIMHTVGVMEYAVGNYAQAESLFIQAKNRSSDKSGRCECDLYLGLCYLRTDRPDYARLAAEEAAACVTTIYQRQNLEKLKKHIEKAYLKQKGAYSALNDIENNEDTDEQTDT